MRPVIGPFPARDFRARKFRELSGLKRSSDVGMLTPDEREEATCCRPAFKNCQTLNTSRNNPSVPGGGLNPRAESTSLLGWQASECFRKEFSHFGGFLWVTNPTFRMKNKGTHINEEIDKYIIIIMTLDKDNNTKNNTSTDNKATAGDLRSRSATRVLAAALTDGAARRRALGIGDFGVGRSRRWTGGTLPKKGFWPALGFLFALKCCVCWS